MDNREHTDMNTSWHEGFVEEYRALRAEVLSQFQNRNNVLTLGSATLGILFNVAAVIGKSDDLPPTDLSSLQITAGFVILALTVPLMTFLIIFLWGVYSSRVAMIGSYLAEKEKDLNRRLGTTAFQWEQRLQNSEDTDELRQAMAVTVVFTAISLISVVIASKIELPETASQISHIGLCKALSWLFLVVGFLVGDYRMYKIKQGFPLDPVRKEKFPFFLLRKILFQSHKHPPERETYHETRS